MKKIIFLLLLTLPLSIVAQNAEQDLESAVKIYNALQEYTTTLNEAKQVTPEVLNSVKKRVTEGISLLDKVIDSGTAEQIKTARYFKVNFKYKQAFVLGVKQDNKGSFNALDVIREEYESYSDPAKFPLRYKYEGKNFVIKYEDFAYTLSQYYMATSELAANLNKSEMQFEYAKKTYNFPKVDPWYKFLATTQIVDYFKDKKQYDTELAQYALSQIKIYLNELTDKDRETLAKINYPAPLSISKTLKTVLDSKPDFANNASILGEAAKLLMNPESRDDIIIVQFFEAAVKGDKYTSDALAFAKSRMNESNIVTTTTNISGKSMFKLLGINILDKTASQVSDTNCDELKRFADDYTLFGEIAKSKTFTDRYAKCLDNKKKEEERREAQRKADEARRERERRRAAREFHVYVGGYVLPLLTKPMDLGGVVNIGAKNVLAEFSYLKITKKKESYFDLAVRDVDNVEEHKWDGYFAHLALKFANRKTSSRKAKIYYGPLFGYCVRNFEPVTNVQVTDKTTNKTTIQVFNPTSKQYNLLFNMGMLALSGIGGDMYFGIGASYNQFDGGNTAVWNKDNFNINNKLLTSRKPTYFSLMGRAGITIGLGK